MPLYLPAATRILAATHNPGKAREIDALLDGRFDVVSAAHFGLPEPEETEASFTGNAILKARHAARESGLISLADDSGFSVVALDGAPGIYSARWAGPDKDFAMAMQRVRDEMIASGNDDTRAYFTCALAVAWPEGPVAVFEGVVHGHVVAPRGDKGFGYDPMFVPEGQAEGESLTFAEMESEQKKALSHRTRAFEMLRTALF